MAKKQPQGNPAAKTATVSPTGRTAFPFWGLAVPLIIVLLIGFDWAMFLLLNDDAKETQVTKEPAIEETGPLKTDGKNPRPAGNTDSHRKNIAKQATDLINDARMLGAREDFDELVAAVAKGDESDLPKDFVAKFRFVDKLEEEDEIRAAGIVSLLQLGQVLDKSLPEQQKLELLTSTAWTYVYVDKEAGNAFVPLSLYLGEDAAFSFEYVWVDGAWVFAPYSFIDAISAADIAASGAQDMLETPAP